MAVGSQPRAESRQLIAVTAAIDRTIRALAEESDVPARLTIRTRERHGRFTLTVPEGQVGASTGFSTDLPPTARTIEIQGWTPATNGKWEIAEIPSQ